MNPDEIKLNVSKLVEAGAPDSDIDDYVRLASQELKTQPQSQNIGPQQDTFLQGHPVLKFASDLLGTTGLGKGISQGIFLRFTPEGKDIQKQIEQGKMKYSDLENIIGKGVTNKEILGSAAQTALSFVASGTSPMTSGKTIVGQGAKTFLKTAGTQALKTGAVGAGLGTTGALAQNKTLPEALKSGAVGFGIGATGSSLVSFLKGGLSQVPRLLSYTSDVPPKVLERQFLNPEISAQAVKDVKAIGQEGLLGQVQSGIRDLRISLSNEFDKGKKALIEKFTNQRTGLNTAEQNLLKVVSDTYPSKVSIPQDVNNLSLSESLDLYKDLNKIKGFTGAPYEVAARELRSLVRDKIVNTFGGKQGVVDNFLKNYSYEKSAHDAMDSLFKAYKTQNPIAQTTALNALKNVFKENKPAYLNTIKVFEQKTGVNVLDKIGALQLQKIMPKNLLGASGNLTARNIAQDLLSPITSPRLAGLESRTAGKLVNPSTERWKTVQTGIKSLGRLMSGQLSNQ